MRTRGQHISENFGVNCSRAVEHPDCNCGGVRGHTTPNFEPLHKC